VSAWWASRSSRGLWALLGTETLSLKALGALGLQAISTGGHRGTLAALIQRAVVSMEPAACAASTTRGGGATCSSAFVEALLALVAALGQPHGGGARASPAAPAARHHAGARAAGDSRRAHPGGACAHSRSPRAPASWCVCEPRRREAHARVSFAQVMMDLSTAAARTGDSDNIVALLCDLGGLVDLESRLQHEVDDTPMETSATASAAAKGKVGSLPP
jgi:hypothetical protein